MNKNKNNMYKHYTQQTKIDYLIRIRKKNEKNCW